MHVGTCEQKIFVLESPGFEKTIRWVIGSEDLGSSIMEHRWSIDICLLCLWQTVRPRLSSASSGSLQLFPLSNKIATHFLCKSPEHLFGLVMGDQLSHCFPYEVASNLLGGPRYPWDCMSIWTRGRKREMGNLYPPDERRNFPSGAQARMKMTCGACDASHRSPKWL